MVDEKLTKINEHATECITKTAVFAVFSVWGRKPTNVQARDAPRTRVTGGGTIAPQAVSAAGGHNDAAHSGSNGRQYMRPLPRHGPPKTRVWSAQKVVRRCHQPKDGKPTPTTRGGKPAAWEDYAGL